MYIYISNKLNEIENLICIPKSKLCILKINYLKIKPYCNYKN